MAFWFPPALPIFAHSFTEGFPNLTVCADHILPAVFVDRTFFTHPVGFECSDNTVSDHGIGGDGSDGFVIYDLAPIF